MKARAFVVSRLTGEPLRGVAVTAAWRLDDRTTPVALLATDDAGYVSFDLADQGGELILEAGPDGGHARSVADGLARVQVARVAPADAPGGAAVIVDPVVLSVDPSAVRRPATITRPAIQGPDVRDWELSPTSFVTPRDITLGEAGCAVPVRSVLPVRRIRYVQIARQPSRTAVRPDAASIPANNPSTADRLALVAPPPGQPAAELATLDPFELPADTARPRAMPCRILAYEQIWTDLGETLGNILYSLPLAPCESVNVAVIEAARQDRVARTDDVTSREELDHSLFRDRLIDESVEGALRERQGGWSLMGGHAGSYSGSWANVGTFSALHSLGGAVSHSWGKRDVEAESTQDLHDAVVQATDVVRTLNSTVVVAAEQTEEHRLETRTVTNHNHCHALTVQYYEVLRRLKLTTSFLHARAGILMPYRLLTFHRARPVVTEEKSDLGPGYTRVSPPDEDDLRLVNRLRHQLEGSMLASSLDANFDAVRRLLFFGRADAPPTTTTVMPAPQVATFVVTVTRGQWGTGQNSVSLRLRLTEPVGTGSRLTNYAEFSVMPGQAVTDTSDPTRVVLASPAFEGDLDDEDATESLGPWTVQLRRPIARRLLAAVEIHWRKPVGDLTPDFSLTGLDVRTSSATGEEVLVEAAPKHTFQQEGFMSFPVAAATTEGHPDPGADAGDATEDRARRRATDEALAWELITHLSDHRDYYSQRIVATKDPSWFAEALDAAFGVTSSIRDHIDGLPVAVSGSYVAFLTDADLPAPTGRSPESVPLATDIISLPTHGVLAEAQLGSCNACEKRDVTRFWHWEESPCERPPEIQGVSPGFRGQTPDVHGAPLPSAVVQITQPPAAPDPIGLAAALDLLGRGDVFRDMSGQTELSQLLTGLASGAVDLAGARKLAAAAQEKARSGAASWGGGTASPTGRPSPAERYDSLQVAREVAGSAKELGWGPRTTEAVTSAIVGGGGASVIPASTLSSPSSGRKPLLLLSGHGAQVEALRRIRDASPITVSVGGQWVEMAPGTLWTREDRLLVAADTAFAWYLEGDGLYVAPASDFVRDHLLGALAEGGAEAGWVVHVSKVEFALISGLLVEPEVLVAVTLIGVTLRIYSHRDLLPDALSGGLRVARALLWLRQNHPDVLAALGGAAWDAVKAEFVQSISAEDIAFWLGRLVRAAYKAGPQASFLHLAGSLAATTALVLVIHSPGIAGAALQAAVDKHWKDLQAELAKHGIQIDEKEARRRLAQLLTDDDLRDQLDEVVAGARELLPLIEELRKAMPDEHRL